jgi:protein-S-isoprenylcysteine O-methyltransferase Ste14
MKEKTGNTSQLGLTIAIRLISFLILMLVLLFLPAGTFRFWQAWLFLAVLFLPVLVVGTYLYRNDRELLERRMRLKEKQAAQRVIIALSWVYLLITFTLPGFDHRFGWSDVPVWVVILANFLILTGYALVAWVFRTNSYASRIIEINEGQRVIDSGPYALIRHPMYLGTMLMYIMMPVALGTWWGLIPSVLIIPIISARIGREEQLLVKELSGYEEYCEKVRFRLIPGIW